MCEWIFLFSSCIYPVSQRKLYFSQKIPENNLRDFPLCFPQFPNYLIPNHPIPIHLISTLQTSTSHAPLHGIFDFQPGREKHPASARTKNSAQEIHLHLRKNDMCRAYALHISFFFRVLHARAVRRYEIKQLGITIGKLSSSSIDTSTKAIIALDCFRTRRDVE